MKIKKTQQKFIIDASIPVNDKIFDLIAYEKYLTDRIKVNGKTGQLADSVKITKTTSTLSVSVAQNTQFAKRYLKYLTKKFLKKQNLRDYLRVVASSTVKGGYELRYFNIAQDDDEE